MVNTEKIVWKYFGVYYKQNDSQYFVETKEIEGCEVFEIVGGPDPEIPLTMENKYLHAYGMFQSVGATYHYKQTLIALRLVASPKDILPTLRARYDELLMQFKECQYWQSVMDQTPRSKAKRAMYLDANNWVHYIIKIMALADKVDKAYAYWLNLRWLRIMIAHHERLANPLTGSRDVNMQPVKDKLEGLTERELALIHCYKQLPPIKFGEPLYADYMRFARPGDRTSYPNESKRKAKSLIRSIEKIKPYLTESEKINAETEIKTLEASFSNQL